MKKEDFIKKYKGAYPDVHGRTNWKTWNEIEKDMGSDLDLVSQTIVSEDSNNILSAIHQFDSLNEKVRDFLYPKLYQLYRDKKLNKGHIPPLQTPENSVSILGFRADGNKISVEIQLYWGGDIYDTDYVDMTLDDWNEIK